jgi:alkanesulfonate monooxygenase SsuD/methylene tetrahydromethanopterin reductase-like flavin-dependent oxidoreductase (luciferase family)
MSADQRPSVGLRLPHELQHDAGRLRSFVAQAEQAGLDRLCVGDHVTFKGGQGFDGLQNATTAAVLSSRIAIQTAVYLLPLRHPVPVARQLATLAALAPGRFVFGVGVGGDDPAELRACGVDPSTRGARTDESLEIVRRLITGEALTFHGRFFDLESVSVLPAAARPIPIVVGGRSAAALRRTARLGDGWLGVWISPDRFAQACRDIAVEAEFVGREVTQWQHGLQVWCGFGPDRDRAGEHLTQQMTALYRLPFEKFARYSPYGTAEDVAAALRPYLEVGCRSFNLVAVAEDAERTIDAASAVRALLRDGAS